MNAIQDNYRQERQHIGIPMKIYRGCSMATGISARCPEEDLSGLTLTIPSRQRCVEVLVCDAS